jgi:hypothetical protein
MKAITQRMLEQGMIGRAIVDRKRSVSSSILSEQRAIDREFGVKLTPSALYSYYISICQNTTWDLLDDSKVSKQLGHTPRAVADTRRKLQKSGWIKFDKFKHRGIEYGIWYIGKDVVKANLTKDTTLEELNELGLITDEEYIAQQPVSGGMPSYFEGGS